jgi:hypothetical protein
MIKLEYVTDFHKVTLSCCHNKCTNLALILVQVQIDPASLQPFFVYLGHYRID